MNWRSFWLWLQSLGYIVFLAIVAAGAALLFVPLWHRQITLQRENRRLETELVRLETLEKQQRQEIEALKTDLSYVERTARDKLNLARPNETIFRFDPPPTNTPPARR